MLTAQRSSTVVSGAPRAASSRTVLLGAASALLVSAGSLLLLAAAALTLFRARQLYARMAGLLSRAVLELYGVRFVVHSTAPFPRTQVVYISNHTSTLDLFLLVALGLPNTRFFLSGFLRKFVPLGIIAWLMGTFFTVPQSRPAERTRIFQRAERTLRRTGDSVYLSPEGGRLTTGDIGPFNKGAFHLATSLRVPIVPFFFRTPAHVDPGLGYEAHPGTVDVYVLPTIDTHEWALEDLVAHVERVRAIFVRVNEEFRCA